MPGDLQGLFRLTVHGQGTGEVEVEDGIVFRRHFFVECPLEHVHRLPRPLAHQQPDAPDQQHLRSAVRLALQRQFEELGGGIELIALQRQQGHGQSHSKGEFLRLVVVSVPCGLGQGSHQLLIAGDCLCLVPQSLQHSGLVQRLAQSLQQRLCTIRRPVELDQAPIDLGQAGVAQRGIPIRQIQVK